MNLRPGKQLPALPRSTVWYIRMSTELGPAWCPDECASMSSVSRSAAARHPEAVASYRAVRPAGKRSSKLRRPGETAPGPHGLDFSTRLRVFQRALRSRVERSGTLLEIMRAVNGTLDPTGLADI